MRRLKLILFLCCSLPGYLNAQQLPNQLRGELLYTTHCNACHTTEVHWREQKLVTDWVSLKHQIQRWQANIDLNWSDEDIIDVAYFLNNHYYQFSITEPKSVSQSKASRPIVHKR